MSLLEELPKTVDFAALLNNVTGSETEGTGVAGVLSLLRGIDTSNIALSLASELEGTTSAVLSGDKVSLSEGITEQFNELIASFPEDPEDLLGPFQEKLDSIQKLAASDLSGQLLEGIHGLEDIQSVVPGDTRALLTGAVEGIDQLREELISGAWGQLRQWSASIQMLNDQLGPVLTGGAGSVEDRLTAYLQDKMQELVKIIFPQQKNPAGMIVSWMDDAVNTELLNKVSNAKENLIHQMNSARAEIVKGNYTNMAHLRSAQESFQELTVHLSGISAKLQTLINHEAADANGMVKALQKQLDDVMAHEIVDLGNIRDMFTDAIGNVEQSVKKLDLGMVKESVDGVFKNINGVIDQFDISNISGNLGDLQSQLRSVLDTLDAGLLEAVASVRNIFEQIKVTLRSIASSFGTFDETGKFQFNIQQDMEGFLSGIREDLENTVKPKVEEFKTGIVQTLQEVQTALQSVQADIESVKTQLQAMLQGIGSQLETLNVSGKVEEIKKNFDAILKSLGEIDFDPVTDPVIAQINDMEGSLKKIDVSSLNDFLKATLKVGVKVVTEIDFPEKITKTLMSEIDEILEIPKKGLKEIEDNIENSLHKLSALEPSVILQPLESVFKPVTEHLDDLKLEKLTEPLDEWHNRVRDELDIVSPEALLEPVIELYDQLKGSFTSISPEELIRPLRKATDDLKSSLGNLDMSGLSGDFTEVISKVGESLDGLEPEKLMSPLVDAFDKILTALDRFNPGDLLRPFINIFDKITAPLDNITTRHVELIVDAFSHLKSLPSAFDPRYNFQVIREKYQELQNLLQQVNPGRIMADLKGPYDSLKASYEATGTDNESITEILNLLNPIRNSAMTGAAADFQLIQSRLQNAFPQTDPPEDLVRKFEEIKPKLDSFVPAWIKDDITPASVKKAFLLANPLHIQDEVNQLYNVVKEEIKKIDPRTIQENVKETFDLMKAKITDIDPEIIVNEAQEVIDDSIERVSNVDLQFASDELEEVSGEVKAIIDGLDPRPIIERLESLTGEVKGLVEELKPSEILSGLNEPYESAKGIVNSFDPSVFTESLQEVFEGIKKTIDAVDAGIILEPLTERLEQLRDELERGLKRTEKSFNGMIAAIPV